MFKEKNLVFIVSQPRAGSTLLQNVLSNNEFVNTVSEPWILLALAPILKEDIATTKYDFNLTLNAISEFEKKYNNFNLRDSVKGIADDFYNEIFENKYRYVIDKTPRYYEILDLIQSLYPSSKILILKRNPVSVIHSLVKKRNIAKADDLIWNNRDLLNAPFLMQNFLDKNENNKNVIELKYEDIVSSTYSSFKKIYQKIGIEYNDDVLNIENNKKTLGKFGDKNLNSSHKFSKIQKKTDKPVLTKEINRFIQGYLDFITSNFLLKYGNYEVDDIKIKKTKVFNNYIVKATKENKSLEKSIYNKFKRA